MEKNYIQNNGKAKGKIYIGLDHGYGNIKTAHRVFTTGVEAYDEEPIVSTNFVKYRDKYYGISGKQNRFRGFLHTDFGRNGRGVEIQGTA